MRQPVVTEGGAVDGAATRRGRKRDPARDVAILDATLHVLADVGYTDITIEKVAQHARAGKATLYRRWPSKDALILAAITHLKRELIDPDRLADTGTLRGDLLALFTPRPPADVGRRLRVLGSLASMTYGRPDVAEAVDAALVAPWATAHRTLIERAVGRGEIGRPTDIGTISHATAWIAAYRSTIAQRPFDYPFLVAIVDAVVLPALRSAPIDTPHPDVRTHR